MEQSPSGGLRPFGFSLSAWWFGSESDAKLVSRSLGMWV